MLINTIEELRLYFPAHAMDRIDGIAGFVDNSEHDFLVEKIGDALYSRLADYYSKTNPQELAETVRLGGKQGYYTELLLCCQRCIVFDAFSRAISVHAVSINDMGVNTATAEDYGKADKDSIDAFKQTCVKEAHAAVNRLLVLLEKWTREDAALGEDASDLTDEQTQRREIVKMWRMSRYFFLAATLLIPSATVLQEYVNIYDSREKFIQLLPTLRYIQEEKIEPALSENMTEYLVDVAVNGTEDKVLCRIIHTLRKAMAAYLEERTTVLKVSSDRKKEAHDEAERMMKRVVEYVKQHYAELPDDIVKTLPFYKEECACEERLFENNDHRSVIFVTPALN